MGQFLWVGLQRVPRAVAATAAAAEVGGPLQPVGVQYCLGWKIGYWVIPLRGIGHRRNSGSNAWGAGGSGWGTTVQPKSPAGVVLIRRHRAWNVDACCERGCDLVVFTISRFHLCKADSLETAKQTQLPTMVGKLDRRMRNMSFRNARFRKGR